MIVQGSSHQGSKKLGINNIYDKSKAVSTKCENMEGPDAVRRIKGDGNCFFRALSNVLSGTENNHTCLRKALVSHMQKHKRFFMEFCVKGFIISKNMSFSREYLILEFGLQELK